MRVLRNLSFVLLVAMLFMGSTIAASDESGSCSESDPPPAEYICPIGCFYEDYPCNGNIPTLYLFCSEVEDCDEVYPNFCDDFEAACYDFCWDYGNPQNRLPSAFSCGTISGSCEAECECVPHASCGTIIED